MIAVALGLTSGLTMCIIMTTSALNYAYGIEKILPLFIGTGIFIILISFITAPMLQRTT